MEHVFLDYMEAGDNVTQILKERAAARGWQPEGLEKCLCSWHKNRLGYGELWGILLAYRLVGNKGSAGFCGRTGLRVGMLPDPTRLESYK